MIVKLSNERLINDLTKLKEISKRQFPVKVSYAIAKNINKVESELKVYESERGKLIDKYAQKDAEGNVVTYENGNIKLKDDCIEPWNKEIKELLSIKNEIDIHKFNISLLDNCYMSAEELNAIDYMLEE